VSAITLAEARAEIAKVGDEAPRTCGGANCTACTVMRVLDILARVSGEPAPPELTAGTLAAFSAVVREELAQNHDGDERQLRCTCDDCLADLWERLHSGRVTVILESHPNPAGPLWPREVTERTVEPAPPGAPGAREAQLWEMVDSLYDGLTAAVSRLASHEDAEHNRDLVRLVDSVGIAKALLAARVEPAPPGAREALVERLCGDSGIRAALAGWYNSDHYLTAPLSTRWVLGMQRALLCACAAAGLFPDDAEALSRSLAGGER